MNANEDKEIERLVEQLMKNRTLETPSFDFTSKVMTQVLESKKSYATTYKPLISKQMGWAIFGVILAVILFSLTVDGAPSNRYVIPFPSDMIANNLTKVFSFSKIGVFGTTLKAIMLLAQITLLRKHFEKH
jgi:hypothetical protein